LAHELYGHAYRWWKRDKDYWKEDSAEAIAVKALDECGINNSDPAKREKEEWRERMRKIRDARKIEILERSRKRFDEWLGKRRR
jgi:hypothetical protein